MLRATPTNGRRIFAAVILLVQGTVLAGVPVLDALLEAAEAQAVTHVEDQDSPPCFPGHDHLFCQLCKLAQLQPAAGQKLSPRPLDIRRVAAVALGDAEPRGPDRGAALARAPPTA